MMENTIERQRTVAGVRFTKVGKLYHFDFSQYPDLKLSDYVIVETTRGRQMGQVMGFTAPEEEGREYKPIIRPATPRDLLLRQYWEAKQDESLIICREKAKELGGMPGVKFIAAMYNYDGSLLTYLYTAEDKVNVSKLWNELNKIFSAQIEMRQIGPRDVAKLLGGYGACGELRCCSTFLTDFSPISIKMAKAQGISLNPTEITGMCGRLRCCLVYEYEQYVEARAKLPKKNKRVGTPLGEGKVIDVLPLQDAVLVVVEDVFHTFKREDLVPIEEFEALAKKAKEPCSRHENGECDCGADANRDAKKAKAAERAGVERAGVERASAERAEGADSTNTPRAEKQGKKQERNQQRDQQREQQREQRNKRGAPQAERDAVDKDDGDEEENGGGYGGTGTAAVLGSAGVDDALESELSGVDSTRAGSNTNAEFDPDEDDDAGTLLEE